MGGFLSLLYATHLSSVPPRRLINADSQPKAPLDDTVDDYSVMTVADMVRCAKTTASPAILTDIVHLARHRKLDLFHYAAALGDVDFFSIILTFLPAELLVHEMCRKTDNGMTPLECASDGVENIAKTILLRRGIELTEADDNEYKFLKKIRDVVGMSATRKKLLQLIAEANKKSPFLMKPVLLQGPPGTGKSFIATCIAAELDRNIVEIKCQEVLTRHLGGTEARILACFQRAVRVKPPAKKAVVVVNEFESLCPTMDTDDAQGSNSWHSTLRQCLITLLDDTRSPRSEFYGLVVVATTNYLDRVDAAVRDRMTVVHVPLPSEEDVKILLPQLCRDHEPDLDISKVNWNRITSIAHEQLSVRGLQDSVSSVAQKCKHVSARTEDFEDAVYDRIGDIPLKLLSRPDHYVRQNVSHSLLESTNVTLETCLARCGWDFASAPASVYRQVLKLEQLTPYPSRKLILREVGTDKLYSGAGCRRKLTKVTKPFDKYEVFIQCGREDAALPVPIDTMACIMDSYGNVGVKKLKWEVGDSLELLPPPTTSMTISAFLAPLLKTFTGRLVYIEVKLATTSLTSILSQHLLLVKAANPASFVAGANAKLIAGSATPDKLRLLGYRIFVTALTTTSMVSPQTSVFYRPSTMDSTGATEVARDRFVRCSNSGTTVGDTLRANGIYYTVCAAVYIQLTEFNLAPQYKERLLAISGGDSGRTMILKGSEVVPFAMEESFRAQFQVFFQCTSASKPVVQGATVLIDKEKIPSVVTGLPIQNVMILRYYPAPGTISRDTPTHHGVGISQNEQIHVSDVGYRDGDFLIGFRRGWYENVYWRTVGDGDNRFLSGGTGENSYKFNIRKEDDFGHVNKRIMLKLPGVGVVFCRGVGPNSENPEMACVLFDSTTAEITNRYGFRGKLGCWRDIVQ